MTESYWKPNIVAIIKGEVDPTDLMEWDEESKSYYFPYDDHQYDHNDVDRIYAEWLYWRNTPTVEKDNLILGADPGLDGDILTMLSKGQSGEFTVVMPDKPPYVPHSMKHINLIGKKVELLDGQGFIQLIDLMPHPASGISGDRAIADAARTSYLGESKGAEADAKLIRRLWKDSHSSPFEMTQFKFLMNAPLVTYWQLVRHRTFHFMSVNSQSGRYTEFAEDAMYFPSEWRKQSSSNKQGSDGLIGDVDAATMNMALEDTYRKGFERYQAALEAGVSKELARLFLPGFAMYYRWIIEIDAKNLMDFLRLRMAPDAQHEIRVFADAIYYHFFKPFLPATAAAFEEFTLRPAGIEIKDAE